MSGAGGERGRRSGCGDYVCDARRAEASGGAVEFAGDESAQAFEFAFARGIMAKEFIGEADRSQRQADGITDVATLRDGEFATAAAEIDEQGRSAIQAGARDEPEVNEARFFYAGDDFDAPSGGRFHPFQKSLGVAGVAKGAGGDYADRVGDDLLRGAMEAAQDFDGFRHRFGSEKSGAEDAFAEAGDFAVFMERFEFAALQTRNFQADGVGADIDCGECGHGPGG